MYLIELNWKMSAQFLVVVTSLILDMLRDFLCLFRLPLHIYALYMLITEFWCYTVRETSLHLAWAAKARRHLQFTSRAKRTPRGRSGNAAARGLHHGFPQWVLRAPATTGKTTRCFPRRTFLHMVTIRSKVPTRLASPMSICSTISTHTIGRAHDRIQFCLTYFPSFSHTSMAYFCFLYTLISPYIQVVIYTLLILYIMLFCNEFYAHPLLQAREIDFFYFTHYLIQSLMLIATNPAPFHVRSLYPELWFYHYFVASIVRYLRILLILLR